MKYLNGGRLCVDLDDLPSVQNSPVLCVDFETTSGDPKRDSLNTWKNCYIAGVCVGVPGHAWYVPVGHNRGGNLPYEQVYKWLQEIIETAGLWVNHNVKYDMHVYSNNLGVECKTPVYDTLTQAKIVDSDRYGYGLDKLSRDWLHKDISFHEQSMAPYLKYNKDYGWIPADVMGYYGTDDAFTTMELYDYIESKRDPECQFVSELENRITQALYKVERSGMNIDVTHVMVTQYRTLERMVKIEEQLEQMLGFPLKPNSDEDCYDLLVNMHGLPVIAWTDNKEPSFDKYALAGYKTYPNAPVAALELMLEYRRLSTFNGTFLSKYLEVNVDGVLHPSYNQTVRTGRMSCKQPNMQQLMSEAKQLIVPRNGHIIVSADYSQIEYRLIVHYIKDPDAIAAYQADPDQDYHQWVADMCGIKRKPAKTINFLMGYGGGKKKLLDALSSDPDLVSSIQASDPDEFRRQAQAKAEQVYVDYHFKLPSLKVTTRQAESLCRQRGYVRNLYGRRRHLPADVARKAFNTVNQSSAADLMKERMLALMDAGYEVIGTVHDELVMTMPKEQYTDETRKDIARILESPQVPLRVPIRCGIGASEQNWLEASKSSSPVHF